MRRSIRAFAIAAIVVLTTESSQAAQRGQASGSEPQTASPAGQKQKTVPPAPAQTRKPGSARAATVKPAPATTVKKASHAKPATLSPVQRTLQRNPGLAAKISGRLPAGTSLMAAASGFRTVGQFVSAVNGSNGARIPFAELKRRMAFDGMTLSQAIQDVRPKSDYRLQAERAETEAAALVGTDDVDNAPTAGQRARR